MPYTSRFILSLLLQPSLYYQLATGRIEGGERHRQIAQTTPLLLEHLKQTSWKEKKITTVCSGSQYFQMLPKNASIYNIYFRNIYFSVLFLK